MPWAVGPGPRGPRRRGLLLVQGAWLARRLRASGLPLGLEPSHRRLHMARARAWGGGRSSNSSRSDRWLHNACRQTGTAWGESVGGLCVRRVLCECANDDGFGANYRGSRAPVFAVASLTTSSTYFRHVRECIWPRFKCKNARHTCTSPTVVSGFQHTQTNNE